MLLARVTLRDEAREWQKLGSSSHKFRTVPLQAVAAESKLASTSALAFTIDAVLRL
jgi:hypothetical protein